MIHKPSRPRAAACGLALALVASQALAAGYPQVQGPGGSRLSPSPVAATGVDTLTGAACVIGSAATCMDPTNAAFSGFIDMPADAAAYPPGRSFQAECVQPGAVKLTAADASTRTVPLQIGLNILPYAVTAWTLSGVAGGASCTYANLK